MDRKRTEGHVVLPIFYHVEPSDVRKHGGSFKDSFDQQQTKNSGEAERWRAALTQVGYIKGFHIAGGIFDR
ncbi:hypothetical protein COLO4_10637 [Corchorus olitorius]|uniref:ADP-ribosyl cyclase/cyclic ADP-ribose hydrolase n=1 Tax=Corchorus olitorius TaxID=93759 RepID=A0A1R3K7S0_9ROSI|nr:hypothetical protein COLO4_10637 [Corchorus olitorius]